MIRSLLLLFALLMAVVPATAWAQGADDIWQRYDGAADGFTNVYTQSQSMDPRTTQGNRVYRQAISQGQRLVEVLEELLQLRTGITPQERIAALDELLTTRQVVGALMTEIGLCEEGLAELEQVLAHPGVQERPILIQTAQRRKAEAEVCIAQQQAEAERLERERRIAELERELAAGGDRQRMAALQRELAALSGLTIGEGAEPRGRLNTAAVVMLAAGSATLLGAVAWDLSLGSARSDVSDYRDTRRADLFDAAQRSADRIDSARVPMAVMYGVGGAAAIGGAIWLAINPRRDAASDSGQAFAPMFLPDGAGVSFSRRF